jgi:hypothetical protein
MAASCATTAASGSASRRRCAASSSRPGRRGSAAAGRWGARCRAGGAQGLVNFLYVRAHSPTRDKRPPLPHRLQPYRPLWLDPINEIEETLNLRM